MVRSRDVTRTVLIVSPHFPPSSLAGVHRARLIAKRLPEHGWRPIVVRVDERHYTEPGDPDLAALVPVELEQVRTGALPASLCRLFGVGDIGIRAYLYLRRVIDRLIETERPDVVFITGAPFYPLLLAARVRRCGVPVVLDFQDPWVSAQGATAKPGSREWLAHRLAVVLEPVAVRSASFVTSVSDIQNDEMAARYNWLDRGRMSAIPIGGDPEDFTALRAGPIDAEALLDPAFINFSYVGAFMPRTPPLARRLFSAVAQVRREAPDLAARLRLNFFGTSNQPGGAGLPLVLPFAEAAGVADLVREQARRLPYLQALSVLANSNAILLIGSDEPHYTASKIYPALLSGRPYLSLFHRSSSAHRLLEEAGGGRAIAFADPEELDGAIPAIADGLRTLATAPESFAKARSTTIEPLLAHGIAGQFAKVFDQVSRK